MRLSIFASGSTGNCALLTAGDRHFLIDAGISAKAIRSALADVGLSPAELDGILITHEHSDHISGLSVLLKRCPIPVYAPGIVAQNLCRLLPGVEASLQPVTPEETFSLGGVTLCCFPTPHDTVQSVGWHIACGGVRFALATDTGHVSKTMLRYLSDADTVMVEANHDEQLLRCGPYPQALKRRILSEKGHLSNEACGILCRTLAEKGVGQIILGHLSRQNNRPDIAAAAVAGALDGRTVGLLVAPEKGRLDVEVTPCFV